MSTPILPAHRYRLVHYTSVLRAISGFGNAKPEERGLVSTIRSVPASFSRQYRPSRLLRSRAAHRRRSPSQDAAELIALSALLTSLGLFLRLGFLGGLLGLFLPPPALPSPGGGRLYRRLTLAVGPAHRPCPGVLDPSPSSSSSSSGSSSSGSSSSSLP